MDEKELYQLVEGFDETELFELLKKEPDDIEAAPPAQTIDRIKSLTYQKLGLAEESLYTRTRQDNNSLKQAQVYPVSLNRNSWRFWGALAASLIVLFLMFAVRTDLGWATLQRAFQYVPGMNFVVKDQENVIERYILPEPIEKQIGSGRIKVEGVIIDDKNAVIELDAQGLPYPESKKIYFTNSKGEKFFINVYGVGGGTGIWHGTFTHMGTIKEKNSLRIVLPGKKNTSINLSLVKAQKYTSFSDMGPTADVDGISITAIASEEHGRARINLLTPQRKGFRIESYGLDPLSLRSEVVLRDNKGVLYSAVHDLSYMGPLSEFYFTLNRAELKGATLTIPRVGVILEDSAKLRITIPRKGCAKINKKVILGGFPVSFNRIERLAEDKIRIHVSTGYSDQKERSLHYFSLADTSYGSMGSQKTGAVESFDLEISPYQLWVTLKPKDPLIYIKGPWDLKF